MSNFEEKKGKEKPFVFKIITNEGRNTHTIVFFYPPNKTFDQSNLHENSHNPCVIH